MESTTSAKVFGFEPPRKRPRLDSDGTSNEDEEDFQSCRQVITDLTVTVEAA
jgi:hypothetical protein